MCCGLPSTTVEVDPSWREDIEAALEALEGAYREFLRTGSYLPEKTRLFQAFKTLPKGKVRYVLFGQDPYPRPESALGYAFIDGAVERIFSPSGLSKAVNRATSLRNFIKMALVADGLLSADDTSQQAIARIDKSGLIDSIDALRRNFESEGVLLLNTSLVFENKTAHNRHARAWRPFVRAVLSRLPRSVELILFGSVAKGVLALPEAARFVSHTLEHPYNHTFVTNPAAHALFGPMKLLQKKGQTP